MKPSHACFYQYQPILLVTGRKYYDFILHVASRPDSVERVPTNEPLIKRSLSYLTTLWNLIIAPEGFEMHVPKDINPFIITEPVESLNYFKLSLASC